MKNEKPSTGHNMSIIRKINRSIYSFRNMSIDSLYDKSGELIEVGYFNKIVIQIGDRKIESKAWNGFEPEFQKKFKDLLFTIIKNNMNIRKDTSYRFESMHNFFSTQTTAHSQGTLL